MGNVYLMRKEAWQREWVQRILSIDIITKETYLILPQMTHGNTDYHLPVKQGAGARNKLDSQQSQKAEDQRERKRPRGREKYLASIRSIPNRLQQPDLVQAEAKSQEPLATAQHWWWEPKYLGHLQLPLQLHYLEAVMEARYVICWNLHLYIFCVWNSITIDI